MDSSRAIRVTTEQNIGAAHVSWSKMVGMAPQPAPVPSGPVDTDCNQPATTSHPERRHRRDHRHRTLAERLVEFVARGHTPNGIRFHETSVQGKEVRVWIIVDDTSGPFLAGRSSNSEGSLCVAPAHSTGGR